MRAADGERIAGAQERRALLHAAAQQAGRLMAPAREAPGAGRRIAGRQARERGDAGHDAHCERRRQQGPHP